VTAGAGGLRRTGADALRSAELDLAEHGFVICSWRAAEALRRAALHAGRAAPLAVRAVGAGMVRVEMPRRREPVG
jgi:hypothetical protein